MHPEVVRAVAYSPVDGAMIATACWNKEVWLWDAGTRKVIERFPATSINTYCLAFRPDGILAAAGYAPDGWGNQLDLWNLQTREKLRDPVDGHRGVIGGIAHNWPGDLVVTAGWDNTIRFRRLPGR